MIVMFLVIMVNLMFMLKGGDLLKCLAMCLVIIVLVAVIMSMRCILVFMLM